MQRAIAIVTLLLASSTFVTAQNQCWSSAPLALDLPDDGQIRAVGDADLDGDVDAIVAAHAAGQDYCAVLFNNGCDLALGAPIAIPSGRGRVIAFADIGGDGIRDLLVASSETLLPGPGPGIYIYQGLPGGTFAPPVFRLTWGYIASFHEGDVNGDGLPDFFAQERTGSVVVSLWYHGTANHTLAGTPVSTLPYGLLGSAGAFTYRTAVLDLDGDQVDDVVLASDSGPGNNITMFRTTPTGMVQLPSVAMGGLSTYNKELAVVDSDQDGDDDLVVVSLGLMEVVEQVAPGNWQVLPAVGVPYGLLTTGDWDGDGDTDLVLRDYAAIAGPQHHYRLLENVGNHTFNMAPPMLADSAYPFGVACADMNGDGFLDYVQGTNIIYGDGTFTGLRPGGNYLADWDGDGDLDYALASTLYQNDGGDVYTATPIQFPPPPVGLQIVFWHDLGDTNNDGLRELVARYVPGNVMRVLSETPSGAFVDVGAGPPIASAPKQVLMHDFDGDGLPDIYAYEYVYLNDGNYGFTQGAYLGQGAVPVAVSDIDGDGDGDVVVRTFGSHTLQVATRTGNTFTTATVSNGTGWQPSIQVYTVVADLDDDGDDDVAASFYLGGGTYEVRVFDNIGGTLQPAGTQPFDGPLTAGDITGDGMTDLCVSDEGRLGILRRTGPGLVYDPVQVHQIEAPTHLADLDQDGDLDVFGVSRALSLRFVAPDAGYRRQYGTGSAGTGSWTPQTSITGIVREGETPSIELTRGLGGSVGFLIVGLAEANAPSPFLAGVQDYIGAIQIIAGFGLGGTLGQAGAGTATVPLAIPPGAFGTNWFLEFVVYDPALPGQFSYTNGCELYVGM